MAFLQKLQDGMRCPKHVLRIKKDGATFGTQHKFFIISKLLEEYGIWKV